MRIERIAVHSFYRKEVNTMEKLTWTQPKIKELDVKETAKGVAFSPNNDASYVDQNGDKWYSYS